MDPEQPRTGEHAQRPGRYELLYRISESVVDPGNELIIELYVSGYGRIESSKLAIYPSAELFDLSKSSIESGVQQTADKAIIFGGQKSAFSEVGVVIDLSGGIRVDNWDRSTMYFDASGGSVPQIMTETKQRGHAPIGMRLTTNQKAKPGSHFIQAPFTYYNGSEWCASGVTIPFSVSNFYQRHEGLVWILGAAAAGAGIVSLGLDVLDFLNSGA